MNYNIYIEKVNQRGEEDASLEYIGNSKKDVELYRRLGKILKDLPQQNNWVDTGYFVRQGLLTEDELQRIDEALDLEDPQYNEPDYYDHEGDEEDESDYGPDPGDKCIHIQTMILIGGGMGERLL